MRKPLVLIFFLTASLPGFAQSTEYASARLAAIGTAVGLPKEEAGTILFLCKEKAYPVIAEYRNGVVVHIGLDIFGQDLKEENERIFRFVERYTLENILSQCSADWEYMMPSQQVSVRGDVSDALRVGKDGIFVCFSSSDERVGEVKVSGKGDNMLFAISFPLDIQLLSGMDKEELENAFLKDVSEQSPASSRPIPAHLKRIEGSLYVSENGSFRIAAVQNTAFFRKTGHSYHPLNDRSKPRESVMTLLTGYYENQEYCVNASFHQYGFENTDLSTPFSNLMQNCLAEGCIPYAGIESVDEKAVIAALFLVNQPLGYCHTFQFTIPLDILGRNDGTMQARGHLYTPLTL